MSNSSAVSTWTPCSFLFPVFLQREKYGEPAELKQIQSHINSMWLNPCEQLNTGAWSCLSLLQHPAEEPA